MRITRRPRCVANLAAKPDAKRLRRSADPDARSAVGSLRRSANLAADLTSKSDAKIPGMRPVFLLIIAEFFTDFYQFSVAFWRPFVVEFMCISFRGKKVNSLRLLEEKILTEGKIFPGDVLKVDSFLNHQLDTELLDAVGAEIASLYKDSGVTKVLTMEASGIAIACFVARELHCPALFAKKSKTANISDNFWSSPAHSYTHGNNYTMVVSREYLGSDDVILIVDDFLASGNALTALLNICRQAGATVVGAGIAIEKKYQGGGDALRAEGLRVDSMATIASMSSEDGIVFC